MLMERHKCKLCSRTFGNGRALGGHMKAHLATLPLPPKPEQPFTESASLSYESEQEAEEEEEKALIYGLRENPKKSFRLADPEYSFAPDTGSVVQDRESETESKNPTRQRSKRNRKSSVVGLGSQNQNLEPKKPKLSFMVSTPPIEPEPVSSVSDTSPEEDVAMCLMMLSRDRWRRRNNVVEQERQQQQGQGSVEEKKSKGCNEEIKIKFKRVRGKHVCDNCGKVFRSSRALGSHRSICCRDEAEARARGEGKNSSNDKIFECPFCFKVFGSGQALGGHKRSHLMPSSSSTVNDSARLKQSFIDLNLPAPPEDDDLSVVSDA